MTEIAFHFNAPERFSYACRLLRKAVANQAKVVVSADAATLAQLDTALWTFSALEFLPHCRAGADASVMARSPIVLVEDVQDAPHHKVLVNLYEDVPAGFERFERVIEIVTGDDENRASARLRWKHYSSRGYAVDRRDLALKETA